jgi:hypothetical protein
MHLNKVDVGLAQAAIDWLGKIDAPVKALQLRVLGGAMARVSEDETAYAHRKQAIMANIAAFYETDDEKMQRKKWVDDFSTAIDQGDSTAYVGFLGPNEQDRLLATYPEPTLSRLKELKMKYDPTNLFKQNYNIQP